MQFKQLKDMEINKGDKLVIKGARDSIVRDLLKVFPESTKLFKGLEHLEEFNSLTLDDTSILLVKDFDTLQESKANKFWSLKNLPGSNFWMIEELHEVESITYIVDFDNVITLNELSIKKGDKVLIVGPAGVGRESLVTLLSKIAKENGKRVNSERGTFSDLVILEGKDSLTKCNTLLKSENSTVLISIQTSNEGTDISDYVELKTEGFKVWTLYQPVAHPNYLKITEHVKDKSTAHTLSNSLLS